MLILLLLAAIVGISSAGECGKPFYSPKNGFMDKIVGGSEVVKHSHFWQIHLGLKSGGWLGFGGSVRFHCGGTIISDKWVLTAAHCITSGTASNYVVRVGQHDATLQESTAQNYKVKRVIKHSGYRQTDYSLHDDIALVEIDGIISFNNAVGAACLPPVNHDCDAGSQGIATGWGDTLAYSRRRSTARAASSVLRQVKVKCIDANKCNGPDYLQGLIDDGMICAGETGKDSCQGDSGGPFVQKNKKGAWEVIGVTSWGIGCGGVKSPGVYARVGWYRAWITEKTGL